MKKAVVLLSGGMDSAVTLYTAKQDHECYALIFYYGQKADKELDGGNVKISIIGDKEALPIEIREEIIRIESKSIDYTGINLNLYLNYGSRKEILDELEAKHSNPSTD